MTDINILQMIANDPEREIPLYELFTAVSQEKTKHGKVDILNKYFYSNRLNSKLLQFYLECLYHPGLELDLPNSIPDYKVNDVIADYVPLKLSKALTRISYFCKGTPDYIENTAKREMFFIRTLEDLSAEDSKLFSRLLLRTINGLYKGITDELLVSTFSFMFPNDYKLDTKK